MSKKIMILFGCSSFFLTTCKQRASRSDLRTNEKPYDLVTHCENGKTSFWGQEAMDADLMQYYLDTRGINDRVKVAVVDSGLDALLIPDFDKRNTVKGEAGVQVGDIHPTKEPEYKIVAPPIANFKYIGDPQRDQSGHGTAVASLIGGAGQQGVAKDIDLTVYRVTGPGETGSTSSEFLDLATYRACQAVADESGVGVVNVSWGGRLDEAGLVTDETDKSYKKLMGLFADKGCLITKAAGNDNFRAQRKYNLDDAYLRVQSTDYLNNLSYFSTTGEVSAPGSSIQVFQSHQARVTNKKLLCSKDTKTPEGNRRFVNGTSFAAPLAAGIASQVVKTLKHYNGFAGLSNPDRVRLINRILYVSQTAGVLNGLKAVRLAEATAIDSSKSLQNDLLSFNPEKPNWSHSLNDQNFCSQGSRRCMGTADQELLSCINHERNRIAICDNVSELDYQEVILASFQNNAFEKAYHYTRQFEIRYGETPTLQNIRRQIIDGYVKRNTSEIKVGGVFKNSGPKTVQYIADIEPPVLRDIMIPYWKKEGKILDKDKKLITDLWAVVFESSSIADSLSYGLDPKTGEDRGTLAVVDSLRRFAEVSIAFGLGTSIENALNKRLKSLKSDMDFLASLVKKGTSNERVGDVAAPVRIVNMLRSVQGFNQFTLDAADKEIVAQLRRFNTYYVYSTESIPILNEVFPVRSTIFELLSRSSVQPDIQDAVNNQLGRLSATEVHYVIAESNKLGINTPQQLDELNWRILSQIMSGHGWGIVNDGVLLEGILLHFKGYDVNSAQYKQFYQLIRDASNVYTHATLGRKIGRQIPFGFDPVDVYLNEGQSHYSSYVGRYSYDEHPWLNIDIRRLLGAKMLTAFPGAANDNETNDNRIAQEFSTGLGMVIGDLIGFQGDFDFTAINHVGSYPDRLSMISPATNIVKASQYGIPYFFTQLKNIKTSYSNIFRTSALTEDAFAYFGRPLPGYLNSKLRRVLKGHSYPPPWLPEYEDWKKFKSESKEVIRNVGIEGYLKNLRIIHNLEPEPYPTYISPGPELD
jgi:hypothetical protein